MQIPRSLLAKRRANSRTSQFYVYATSFLPGRPVSCWTGSIASFTTLAASSENEVPDKMASCQDESHGHDHGDGHGHDHHSHDHSEDQNPAVQSLLWDKIDFPGVQCFNEKKSGSAVAILKKPWSERLTPDPVLESDADEQLLIVIP